MELQELLKFSQQQTASDLHLSAGLKPMLRVDGDIQTTSFSALTNQTVQSMLQSIMSEQLFRDYEESLEIDFSFEIENILRCRVNAFKQARGHAVTFRFIPSTILSLAELNAPKIIQTICEYQHGLVLVTGATGSGKSTTLAAMVDYINRNKAVHILTIEDPIEFIHQNHKSLINQRELKTHTHSFAQALKSALREDPDVILIGELRDLETIRLAMTAAETGHLVLATLHTSSAAKTVDRIIDVFPSGEKSMARSMLSGSLQAVIAQKLLKKKQGGRIAVHEIMLATPAIRNLIREDKAAQMLSVIQTNRALGMQTMDQAIERQNLE